MGTGLVGSVVEVASKSLSAKPELGGGACWRVSTTAGRSVRRVPDPADLPMKTFQRGRVCAESECRTRLSIYNDGTYCALHLPLHEVVVIPRGRRKRAA